MARPTEPGLYWVNWRGVYRVVEARYSRVARCYSFSVPEEAAPIIVEYTHHSAWLDCGPMPDSMRGCIGVGDVDE